MSSTRRNSQCVLVCTMYAENICQKDTYEFSLGDQGKS